jgi:multiple sugar transport system permease protein
MVSKISRFVTSPKWAGYLFLAPTMIYLIVMSIFPLIYAINASLRRILLTKPYLGRPFIGLGNFIRIAQDGDFWYSFWATLYFSLVAVSIELILGLAIALLLHRDIKGMGLVRTIVILPMMVAPVVVGLAWKYMLDANEGVINYFLSLLGIKPLLWLASPSLAIPSIILTDIWQWTPLFALLLLAGLQSLPQEPYEAAKVDGANAWQTFRYLTIRFLQPFILTGLLLRVMDTLRAFDTIFVMTNGGPGRVTEFLSMYAYRKAFSYHSIGYGTALSFVILILIVILSNFFVSAFEEQAVEV